MGETIKNSLSDSTTNELFARPDFIVHCFFTDLESCCSSCVYFVLAFSVGWSNSRRNIGISLFSLMVPKAQLQVNDYFAEITVTRS